MIVPTQIDVQGSSIVAMFHISELPLQRNPVIVMCYGYNGTMCEVHRMSVKMAKQCESSGLHMFRFDYRDHAHSIGNTASITMKRKLEDVLSVIEFINCCFRDKPPIYLVGFSDGARIVAEIPNFVNNPMSLIYWNPVFSMKLQTTPNKNHNQYSEKDRGIIRDSKNNNIVKELYGMKINIPYYKDCMKHDTLNLSLSDKQELYILSDDDPYTAPILELYNRKHNDNHTLYTLHNAGHLFGDPCSEKTVIDLTINWIIQRERFDEKRSYFRIY